MKLAAIANSFIGLTKRTGFQIKKHSPEILVITSIVAGIGCVVCACKATMGAQDVIKEHKEMEEHLKDCIENGGVHEETGEPYTQEEYERDKVINTCHTAIALVKLYAPAAGLGILSVVSVLTSNNIMRKRNFALAAAYATISNEFEGYRKRLVERFGDKVDHELRYNISNETIEEKVTDEDGNEQTVQTEAKVSKYDGTSQYARFFDETNPNWKKNAEYNLTYLRCAEKYLNCMLKRDGYMFLNDVYKYIGCDLSWAGQSVGWTYNKEHQGYISFGLDDVHDEGVRRFVNGYERSVLLDFNVEGNIMNIVDWYNKDRELSEMAPGYSRNKLFRTEL
jgi:hypothetical protein